MNRIACTAVLFALTGSAMAADRALEVDPVACLPNEANQALTAGAEGLAGGDSVRAFFRRLHPSGAFYSVAMEPTGEGRYWTVLPKPEDRRQPQLSDEWWEILRDRDWVAGRDREEIEDWLEELEHEAAEYFVAVYDDTGRRVARSEDLVVEVLDGDDCAHELTAVERGWAWNLTVGETTPEQIGKPVFHWLCDGVVTRLAHDGVLRSDDFCRSCVLAAWYPLAVAAAAPTIGITVYKREPERPSDVEP